MTREDYDYDEDEFDVLGADRTPQGVHRAPVPRWRQLLPFIAVLVLAPLLAWAGVSALSGDFGRDSDSSETATQDEGGDDEETGDGEDGTEESGEDEAGEEGESEEPTDEGEEPTEDATEDPTDEATEEETEDPAADVDQSVFVLIMNGTQTNGLGGTAVERINAEGWTNSSATDYGFAEPTITTVYYNNAGLEEEANAVADLLGIDTLVESSSAASNGIVIVLRSDFE